MKIYRLQDEGGWGPYYNYDTYKALQDAGHFDFTGRYPSIVEDIDHFEETVDICGCTSIKKLNEWFGKKLMKLAKSLGFKVVYYKIDECYVKFGKSGKQVAFDPDLADEWDEI